MFTKLEKVMARKGYVYSRKESKGGLRREVFSLDGKRKSDLIFDHSAYNIHMSMDT